MTRRGRPRGSYRLPADRAHEIVDVELELTRRLGFRPAESDIAAALKCSRSTLARWRKGYAIYRRIFDAGR